MTDLGALKEMKDEWSWPDMTHAAKNQPTQDVPWIPAFEIGDALLDWQHRRLLEDSGVLKKMVASGRPWPDVCTAVSVLVKDCIEHFRAEESILCRAAFPRWASHTAQHHKIEGMLEELSALVARVDGTDPRHRRMVASLEVTIVNIILRHDLDYKSHLLNEQGI